MRLFSSLYSRLNRVETNQTTKNRTSNSKTPLQNNPSLLENIKTNTPITNHLNVIQTSSKIINAERFSNLISSLRNLTNKFNTAIQTTLPNISINAYPSKSYMEKALELVAPKVSDTPLKSIDFEGLKQDIGKIENDIIDFLNSDSELEDIDFFNHSSTQNLGKIKTLKTETETYALKMFEMNNIDFVIDAFKEAFINKYLNQELSSEALTPYYGVSISKDKNTLCLVNQLVEGERLSHKEDMTNAEKLTIGSTLINSIFQMHKIGICHLDIKPDNVIVDKSTSHSMVIDYGNSHLNINKIISLNVSEADLLGSIGYIAPEILNATENPEQQELYDTSQKHYLNDSFQLGATLFEFYFNKKLDWVEQDDLSFAVTDKNKEIIKKEIEILEKEIKHMEIENNRHSNSDRTARPSPKPKPYNYSLLYKKGLLDIYHIISKLIENNPSERLLVRDIQQHDKSEMIIA